MILCYIEHQNNKLGKSSLVAIEAALIAKRVQGYKKVVGVLLGGQGVGDAATETSFYGLDEVVYVESPNLSHYLALTFTSALKKVIAETSPELVVALASSQGKDLFPRISGFLEAGLASDVVSIKEQHIFTRPMFAGNIFADVEITTQKKVVTIRGSNFDAAKKAATACPVKKLSITVEAGDLQQFVSFETTKSERPELTEADVIISGGRALKSAENFEKLIFPLADLLGAAVGASRAAVDSGYAPNDWQVGQTGKIVAPKLYIAIGISGAIQHLAGMKDSKVIVAINKDADAPIFEIADYALVGDLYQVIPELIEEIKKAKA